jgi:hypothetical protein
MRAILASSIRTPALLLAGFASVSIALGAQTLGGPERFTALAVNLDRGGSYTLEIVVDRWSNDAERSRLLGVLLNKGADHLLDALQSNPKVGYIRNTNGGLAWDLHYSRHVALPDGGEQVTVATDRPIAFREQASGARTLDYPFTIIELKIDSEGEGEGKMSAAAKIIPDKKTNTVVVENWGLQPILLQGVMRENTTRP